MKVFLVLAFCITFLLCYEIIEDPHTSGFKYRQDFLVQNTGNAAVDKISLEIDGEALIKKNLFENNNYFDVRFKTAVTKNGTSVSGNFVDHWFETSFNKNNARVWIKLDQVLEASETRKLYMYMHSNATQSYEMEWDGKFITMKENGCGQGTEEFSDINGYFLKFGTSFGETTTPNPHTHLVSGESNAVGKTEDTQGFSSVHSGYFFDTHTHRFSTTSLPEVMYPLHQKVPFCSSPKLEIEDDSMYFTTCSDRSDLPYGYQESIFETTSKFIMGGSSFMEDGNDSHTHSQISIESPKSDSPLFSENLRTDLTLWDQTKPTGVMLKNHTHNVVIDCNTGSSLPAYKTVIVGKVIFSSIAEPDPKILFIASQKPPIGWTQYTEFDENSYYQAGKHTGDENLIKKHSHSCTVDFEVNADVQFSKNGGDWGVINQNHDHQSTVEISIVMEFCEFGDLFSYLAKFKNQTKKKLPNSEKIRFLSEIVSGMAYLHSRKIIHRDLKPENVLVNREKTAKLMDFGLSKFKEQSVDQTMTKTVGTSFYISPEVIRGKYSFPCDVYSWAILGYVLITENSTPFGRNQSQGKILDKIKNDVSFRPLIHKENFKGIEFLIDLLKRNWDKDPTKRNTFEELKQILSSKLTSN